MRILSILALTLSPAHLAQAIINPTIQPIDLFERYNSIFLAEIVEIDTDAATFTMQVEKSHKGEDYGAGRRVTVHASEETADLLTEGNLNKGSKLLVYAGSGRRNNVLLYNSTIKFGVAKMGTPDKWQWQNTDSTLMGVWAGSTEGLDRLLGDIAAGVGYLPRMAYVRFQPDILLYNFDGPARGVALYDFDGDGRLDIFAASDQGAVLLRQGISKDPAYPVWFEDVTKEWGLEGITGPSVSIADVNANGRPDLLAGATLYLAREQGGFERSDLLPEAAGEGFKTAAFVELNGDGYPDVLVATEGRGLRAFLNPGAKGGTFVEATVDLGLDVTKGGNGFFAVGDWTGNGRTDLFYAFGNGMLLRMKEEGGFEVVEHEISLDFTLEDGSTGMTGAAALASLFSFDRMDLAVPQEDRWNLITHGPDSKPLDVTTHGGEITENSTPHLATLVEDFGLDGNLDLYTVVSHSHQDNRLQINRGYGKFMHAEKQPYYKTVFQGPAHDSGGWGLAAGDVTGDGAPDLLISNTKGEVTLLLNETLKLRAEPVEHPVDNIRSLKEVALLSVHVSGNLGVLGATVALARADGGQRVGYRMIGDNITTGNRGPDGFTFAVRQPGPHTLTVRFSDGQTEQWEVQLEPGKRIELAAKRGGGKRISK